MVGTDGFLAAVKGRTGRQSVGLLVAGFTAGTILGVRVNRLLRNNIDVHGVGWGACAMVRPGFMAGQWRELEPMMAKGVIDPPIGATYDPDGLGRALADLEERKTVPHAMTGPEGSRQSRRDLLDHRLHGDGG